MAMKYNDFGEKIGSAKKDLWKDRGLYAEDLSNMNSREADAYVKKDNIWKKPDYQAMIDSGIPFDVVYYIKKVRDSLNVRPHFLQSDDTPEKRLIRRKEYIDTVREVQTVMEAVRTHADAMDAFKRFAVGNGYAERVDGNISGGYYAFTSKGTKNCAVTDKLVKTLHVALKAKFEFDFTWPAKKEQFGAPKEEKVPRGYAIWYNDAKETYPRDSDWKPDTYYVTKGHQIVKTNFEDRSAALKWVQEFARQRTGSEKKRFVPPQLADVRREGPEYRHGRDAAGQDYMDTFGFRGGEFGNWMSQDDRRESLNMGFDALKDLAEALEINNRDISYQGALSIAFGARGGGTAVAHYEPMRKVINLTKMRGAGSLAHEWWHGLDDYLGSKFGSQKFLSESHLHNKMDDLLDTIHYKLELSEQAKQQLAHERTQALMKAEKEIDTFVLPEFKGNDKALAEYVKLKAAYLKGEPDAVERLDALKKEVTGFSLLSIDQTILYSCQYDLRPKSYPMMGKKVETDYYRNSKRMGQIMQKDGGYWESNTELTARAFATYVMDRLPHRSDYLVGHAESAVNFDMDKEGNLTIIRAFPQGEERTAINAAFDELIFDLKLENHLSHEDNSRPIEIPERPVQAPVEQNIATQISLTANVGNQPNIAACVQQKPSLRRQLSAAKAEVKASPANAVPKKNFAPEI